MSRPRTLAIFSVCVTLICAGRASFAASCDAGYYLTDNGDCAACPSGTYSDAGATECTTVQAKYYATGCDENGTACTGMEMCETGHYCTDGKMFECPDPDTHWRTTFPDYYYENPVVVSSTTHTQKGHAGNITECRVITGIDSDRGHVSDYARYNPETDEYDISSFYLWSAVKPGYYLTNANACGTYAYYLKLLECPAGSYCPGKEHVVCNAANKDEVLTPTFGLETCPAGTYSNAGAAMCTPCPAGTYSDAGAAKCTTVQARYYATGCSDDGTACTGQEMCKAGHYCTNGKMFECPDPMTHKRTTFQDLHHENPVVQTAIHVTPAGHAGDISRCQSRSTIKTDRGALFEYVLYNPDTNEYDLKAGTGRQWYIVEPGYYLTGPNSCGTFAYYDDAVECPAGSYCPGKNYVICTAENRAEVHTPTFGLETCPVNTYSDAGASSCSECPTGTGNSGGHIGATSCMPLCTGGLTKLNVAGRKFNLWPRDRRTSPALCTDVNDNVCCVNMAPGNGPGINVELHNQVYHTTN